MSASERPCEVALLEYAYGELPSAEAAEVEQHVSGCAGCAQALEGMRGVRRVMAQLPEEPPPEGGLASLLAYAEQSARRAAAGPAPSPGTWRRWLAPLLGVGALATLAFIALPVAEQVRVPLPSKVAAGGALEQKAPATAPAKKEALRTQPLKEAFRDIADDALGGSAGASPVQDGAAAPGTAKAAQPTARELEDGAPRDSAGPPGRAVAAPRANAAPGKGSASAGRDEGYSLGALGTGRGGFAGGRMAGGGGAALPVDEASTQPAADRAGPAPVAPEVRTRAREARQEPALQAGAEALAEASPPSGAAPAAPPPARVEGFTEAKKATAPAAKLQMERVAGREAARAAVGASESDEDVAPSLLGALRRAAGEAKRPAERQAALRRLCDAERATTPAHTPGCEQLAREFPPDGGLSR